MASVVPCVSNDPLYELTQFVNVCVICAPAILEIVISTLFDSPE